MSPQLFKENGAKGLAGKSVRVIGPNRFRNELLSFFLEKEIGVQCYISDDPDNIDTKKQVRISEEASLILIECPDKDLESYLSEVKNDNGEITNNHFVALFNVDHGKGIEEKAVVWGIKGIFYKEDPLERFKKGVGAIFEGELWVSREILTRCVMENRVKDTSSSRDEAVLTSREMEILAMIATGSKNEEIADKLYISPNTVKTHIYNIFKKIDVPNRLQAALWAAKNL